MKEANTIFQDISVRRRVIITVVVFTMLTIAIGLYSLIAIVETNKRLNKSVVEGATMAKAIDTARLAEVHFKIQVQEWKNILLRGNDKALFDKHLSAFNEESRQVNNHLQSLSQLTVTIGISAAQIDKAIKDHEALGQQYIQALREYKESDLKSAVLVDKKVRGIDREPTEQIDTLVITIKNLAGKRLKETETIAKTQLEAYQSFSYFLVFLVLIGVCFGVFNAWSIVKDLPKEENGSEREEN